MNKHQCENRTDLSVRKKHKASGEVTEKQNHIKTEGKLFIDIDNISFRLDFSENEETVNK
ncbi:hypothetical protein MmazTMA_33060 [Methanosarcina mazei]|jgi:hypothetical protein|nr:hypothetical protein MmazTMA_33060 [Methanosarcina mazei]